MFDISNLKKSKSNTRYASQIDRMARKGFHTENIETAVRGAMANIHSGCRSFVIYGEPQSGKTEMMIALTAQLLDEGHRIVILLLNDSVQLLNQNLVRFKRSGINPAPKNFLEILDPTITIGKHEWIVFSKKNPKDLTKLIDKLGSIENKVIIDDEADFATPNGRINRGEQTKINELVEELIGDKGMYIGVTATPARLDMNNTFRNENENWVDFPPHPLYKGQETFFPTSIVGDPMDFLKLLPDQYDDPKYLRDALLRFLVNVAHLNLTVNKEEEKNYCILVHTSGKKADHTKDYQDIVSIFKALNDETSRNYNKYYEEIWSIADERYPGEASSITQYVFDNRNRNDIVKMNSDTDKNVVNFANATNPATLFTIAIGGNIVSRGVTFDNLLSMFFTRDVKHKIQQDTYIQRARMFGSRGEYLPTMELHIPNKLYSDWHRCFVFHKLSLESIRRGNGSPVWIEDKRISAVASGSIDKTTVAFDSGEMSYEIFSLSPKITNILQSSKVSSKKLRDLSIALGDNRLPEYLLEFIDHFSPDGDDSLAIHEAFSISSYGKDTDKKNIQRQKGFIGNPQLKPTRFPKAIHHIFTIYNEDNSARVFYKFIGGVKFLRNLRKSRLNGQ